MENRRPLLTLPKKVATTAPTPPSPPPAPSEPAEIPVIEIQRGDRRVRCAAVRRKKRFLCVAMGREKNGPTRIHPRLQTAMEEAARIVAETDATHIFVVHVVASAKLVESPSKVRSS